MYKRVKKKLNEINSQINGFGETKLRKDGWKPFQYKSKIMMTEG